MTSTIQFPSRIQIAQGMTDDAAVVEVINELNPGPRIVTELLSNAACPRKE
jgi:hypothetical protein